MTIHSFYPESFGEGYFTSVNASNPWGTADNDTVARAYAVAFRDLIKNGDGKGYEFNVGLPSPRWIVGDIAEFVSSLTYGYAFQIRDTVSLEERLFIWAMQRSSGSGFITSVSIGGTSYTGRYAQDISTTPHGDSLSANASGFVVYSNLDYTVDTFAMEYDDPVNLTYSGGDFFNPTTLPATNVTQSLAFLPTLNKNPRGFLVRFNETMPKEMFFQFDDVENTMSFMRTEGGEKAVSMYAIAGSDVFIPDGADTYTQGMIYAEFLPSNSAAPGMAHGNGYADGFDENGNAVTNYDLLTTNAFTRDNELKDEGGVMMNRWRRVGVESGGSGKGFVKPSIMREIGAFSDPETHGARYQLADRQLYKIHPAIAVAYPNNVGGFPFDFTTR